MQRWYYRIFEYCCGLGLRVVPRHALPPLRYAGWPDVAQRVYVLRGKACSIQGFHDDLWKLLYGILEDIAAIHHGIDVTLIDHFVGEMSLLVSGRVESSELFACPVGM